MIITAITTMIIITVVSQLLAYLTTSTHYPANTSYPAGQLETQ